MSFRALVFACAVSIGSLSLAQPAKYSTQPTDVLKDGKEYTHSSGGKFKYPRTRELKEMDGFLMLTPPNAKEGEFIMIVGDSAEGETDPGSPQVLDYLDGQISESVPDAQRVGKIEKTVAGAGKGVIISWKGTVNGSSAFIRAYVTIVKSYGIALIAVGKQADVESRDAELRQIYQTIGWGQGKLDKRLIGTWNYWGYKGSSDGKYGREERATAVLNSDGTFSYSNSAETAMTASGDGWAGGMASRRGDGYGGTWTADGGSLFLNFADGTSESFDYKFEQQGQNTFLVINPDDKKHRMEWSRGS